MAQGRSNVGRPAVGFIYRKDLHMRRKFMNGFYYFSLLQTDETHRLNDTKIPASVPVISISSILHPELLFRTSYWVLDVFIILSRDKLNLICCINVWIHQRTFQNIQLEHERWWTGNRHSAVLSSFNTESKNWLLSNFFLCLIGDFNCFGTNDNTWLTSIHANHIRILQNF